MVNHSVIKWAALSWMKPVIPLCIKTPNSILSFANQQVILDAVLILAPRLNVVIKIHSLMYS